MTQSTRNIKENQGKATGSDTVLCFATLKSDSWVHPTYWIRFDEEIVDRDHLEEALTRILVDETLDTALKSIDKERLTWSEKFKEDGHLFWAEKQFLPGVTDNLSNTIEEALRLMSISSTVSVTSGATYLIGEPQLSAWEVKNPEQIVEYASYKLFHPLVERFCVHDLNNMTGQEESLLTFSKVSLTEARKPKSIDLNISDSDLESLSRDRLLALSLEEMKVVQKHFKNKRHKQERETVGLPENPTDVEMEVIAQTWSEHCKHKIFNARIEHAEETADKKMPVHHKVVNSLYKTYIKGATKKLSPQRPDLLSVFEDNSGIVKWDENWGVCFKVETHNSPSALEPYGGALTGILGVNRDILGTGLGAKPIFNTDIFCFASPNAKNIARRPKLLPVETIPRGVRKGVEDGGNKSGIPTVNGAVVFHDGYRAKPLVFCGTGGILPLKRDGLDHVFKHTRPGDKILMVGGRVGKDGIHGATFSSESLHEGSPVTAVQIGDPFTQKRVIDFTLAAQDQGLISGITDNGAGGLSSSVGEMATITGGATIDLDKIPLKYPGLEDWEIVISESQERMTISSSCVDELVKLAEIYNVEVSEIGEFTDNGFFEVKRGQNTVARLNLEFLHDGLPAMELKACWKEANISAEVVKNRSSYDAELLQLLAHDNISSREPIVRQYDHEVQGRSVIKPLMGEEQCAPCDAAVILPVLNKKEALVVSNGICPQWSRYDTYLMAVLAVDEAVRNGVCVGADPDSFSLLDNFCWPDPVKSEKNEDGDHKLGQLVRACQGLYDACLAYGAPLISGKDSMKNDFDDGVIRLSIPPTLLVSAIARMADATTAISSEFKLAGSSIFLLSAGSLALTGSHYDMNWGEGDGKLPQIDLEASIGLYRTLHQAIRKNLVVAAHDLSEGGLAVCLAESVIGGRCGAEVNFESPSINSSPDDEHSLIRTLFGEGPSSIVVEIPEEKVDSWLALWRRQNSASVKEIGKVQKEKRLKVNYQGKTVIDSPAQELKEAWQSPVPVDTK